MTHTFMQDPDVHLVSPNANDNGLFTDIGAATVGRTQTGMDWWVSDNAAIPPVFALTEDFKTRPESSYRLEYLEGEDPTGTWRLDIRDYATGDTGTLNGWALKICQNDPDAPSQTLFSTDFEANDGGFTHNGTLDEWEYGTPATVATTTTNPVAAASARISRARQRHPNPAECSNANQPGQTSSPTDRPQAKRSYPTHDHRRAQNENGCRQTLR